MTIHLSYVKNKVLTYNARNNPDKYILPLDIVSREGVIKHYGIYLGNG
jgi:hypothetical protein